jgi:hypothetical protein
MGSDSFGYEPKRKERGSYARERSSLRAWRRADARLMRHHDATHGAVRVAGLRRQAQLPSEREERRRRLEAVLDAKLEALADALSAKAQELRGSLKRAVFVTAGNETMYGMDRALHVEPSGVCGPRLQPKVLELLTR